MHAPRIYILFLVLVAVLASGCSGVRSRVAVQETTSTFIIEDVIDRWIFGSSKHVSEINVDNAKLNQRRPLVIADLNFVSLDGTRYDPTTLEGFLWYLPWNEKVLIGIGQRMRDPADRSIMPLIFGEYEVRQELRR